MKTIKEIYKKATKPLDDRLKEVKAKNKKALEDPNSYNPFSSDRVMVKKSLKMSKEGLKAIPKGFKARAKVRKNINSMANTDAVAELRRTKNLPVDQRGTNDAFNRAGKAYSNTKKKLNKQIPRKYRSFLGL